MPSVRAPRDELTAPFACVDTRERDTEFTQMPRGTHTCVPAVAEVPSYRFLQFLLLVYLDARNQKSVRGVSLCFSPEQKQTCGTSLVTRSGFISSSKRCSF